MLEGAVAGDNLVALLFFWFPRYERTALAGLVNAALLARDMLLRRTKWKLIDTHSRRTPISVLLLSRRPTWNRERQNKVYWSIFVRDHGLKSSHRRPRKH
jgi:hypothetical protein